MNQKKQELVEYAKGLNCQESIVSWIEKRIEAPINISECEHIIDYLNSDKCPKRLNSATYKQMLSNSKKWTKSLAKKGKDLGVKASDVEVVLDFKDGFKIVKLLGENEYKREGFLMRHCVASYYGKDVEIYSLRDKDNMPHCTMERDVQIKGKGNGEIHPKYIDYVVKFLEWSGMTVRDSEMENLGYVVPEFPDYVQNKLYKDKYIRKTETVKYSDNVKIFTDINEAVEYKGEKVCLFSGDADFECSKITDLGKLTSIGGGADFECSKITDLGKLTSIGGSADFGGSKITDLGKLTSIGGSADFGGSKLTDLGKLTSIGGSADFGDSKITDLGKLTSIGGSAYFRNSKLTDLGKLTSIGGSAYFSGSKITDLGKLTSIGGSAYFSGSKITDLGKLTSIGGSAYFRDSKITDLGKLTSIGGSADFRDSKLTDLGKLTSIGGSAYFGGFKITDLGKLTSIGGSADFGDSKLKPKDIEKLKTISNKNG